MQLVDTNVILRFLVGDDKKQQVQAKDWFKQAQEGKLKLLIKPLVVAEASFVLESFYKKDRLEIAEVFLVMLSQKWLLVEDREIMLKLWLFYKQGLHFVDSYLLTAAKVSNNKVLSFDKELLSYNP